LQSKRRHEDSLSQNYTAASCNLFAIIGNNKEFNAKSYCGNFGGVLLVTSKSKVIFNEGTEL
jgi:hypothetical protein